MKLLSFIGFRRQRLHLFSRVALSSLARPHIHLTRRLYFYVSLSLSLCSSHLSPTCFLVYPPARLSIIISISDTPAPLRSSSITPPRRPLSVHIRLCEGMWRRSKMEWDNLSLFILSSYVYSKKGMSEKQKALPRCPAVLRMWNEVTCTLFTTSWHELTSQLIACLTNSFNSHSFLSWSGWMSFFFFSLFFSSTLHLSNYMCSHLGAAQYHHSIWLLTAELLHWNARRPIALLKESSLVNLCSVFPPTGYFLTATAQNLFASKIGRSGALAQRQCLCPWCGTPGSRIKKRMDVWIIQTLFSFQGKIPGIGFLKIHATWNTLCREAEFMKLKMPTKMVRCVFFFI